MSNKKKYLALAGGLTCREASDNPHWKYAKGSPDFALTEVMPEGETFDGVIEKRVKTSYGDTYRPLKVSRGGLRSETVENLIELGRDVKDFIKPLKAIEAVEYMWPNCTWESPVFTECEQCKTGLDMIPSPNVVENKETVEQKAKQLTDIKFPDAHNYLHNQPHWYKQGCIDTLKSQQSIEGIVGFVLEWVAEKSSIHYVTDIMGKSLSHITTDVNRPAILNMKSDIIKELKNGK